MTDETIKTPLHSALKKMSTSQNKKNVHSSNNLMSVKKYFIHVSTFRIVLDQYVFCLFT